jgi:hypothetical protein
MHSRLDTGYNPTVLWNNSLVASGIGYLDLGNLEDPIETIFSDPSRRAILKNMIDESIYMSSSDKGFLTFLNEVIKEIEAEIQKN